MNGLSVTRLYDRSRLPPPLPRLAPNPLPPDRLPKKKPEIKIVDLSESERYLLGMKLQGMMPKYTVTDYYCALITHIVVKSEVPFNLQDALIDRVVADSGCGMAPKALVELHLCRMLQPKEKTKEPEPVAIEAEGPVDDQLHILAKLPSGPDTIHEINGSLQACYSEGKSSYMITYDPSTDKFLKSFPEHDMYATSQITMDEIRDLKDFLYELAATNPILREYIDENPRINDRNPYELPPGIICISKNSSIVLKYADFKLIYRPDTKVFTRRPHKRNPIPFNYDTTPSRAEIRKMKADIYAESLFKQATAEYLAAHHELKLD
jgi:hypothetical protein